MSNAGPVLPRPITEVVEQLQARIEALPVQRRHRRVFLQTYLRITEAVGVAVAEAAFEDPAWVVEWDVRFAELCTDAYDAEQAERAVARPWRLAFGADTGLHPLIHLLLGMNAHINFDLPQAMLAVITTEDFDDPVLIERRRRDHERIDDVLASCIAAEDRALGGGRRLRDLALTPLNRLSSRRFLTESRHKVWHNAVELEQARRRGPEAYAERLGELEVLAAAKVADLLRPGQVLLNLALTGFGVTLPPP